MTHNTKQTLIQPHRAAKTSTKTSGLTTLPKGQCALSAEGISHTNTLLQSVNHQPTNNQHRQATPGDFIANKRQPWATLNLTPDLGANKLHCRAPAAVLRIAEVAPQ